MRKNTDIVKRIDDNFIGPALMALLLVSLGSTLGYALTGSREVAMIFATLGLYAAFGKDLFAQFLAKVYIVSGLAVILVARPDLNGLQAMEPAKVNIIAWAGVLASAIHFFWVPLKYQTQKALVRIRK